MNLNKNVTNQTEKSNILCLILFFIITILCIRVVYVNAAENKEETIGKEEVIEAIAGTSRALDKQMTDKIRIRMANEDAIPVAEAMTARFHLTPEDYSVLTRIVEAEATGLDKKSKILVANVILNRLKSEQFPDTVKEVVFQKVNGATQFSPVSDGRYYSVKITDSTVESVDRALAGEDYSQGALYFMERSMSSASSVRWFDRCLTRLFKYQGHEFYK